MKGASRTLLIVLPNKSHEFLIKSGLKVEQSEAMMNNNCTICNECSVFNSG